MCTRYGRCLYGLFYNMSICVYIGLLLNTACMAVYRTVLGFASFVCASSRVVSSGPCKYSTCLPVNILLPIKAYKPYKTTHDRLMFDLFGCCCSVKPVKNRSCKHGFWVLAVRQSAYTYKSVVVQWCEFPL